MDHLGSDTHGQKLARPEHTLELQMFEADERTHKSTGAFRRTTTLSQRN